MYEAILTGAIITIGMIVWNVFEKKIFHFIYRHSKDEDIFIDPR